MAKGPFQRSTWRLILTPPHSGAWNMAVDEAILEAAGRGAVLPTLRLYAWEPPCLSLGYAQPVSDVDYQALERHDWQIVRRLTGGRAILHTDELTYSVAGPLIEPRLHGGVLESYYKLAQALLQGLELLGLPAEALEKPGNPGAAQPPNPICFETPSNYEITAGGRKLLGSAQARRKDGVLQHGSLPLTGDLGRIVQALRFASETERSQAAVRLLARAATAETIAVRKISWDEAATAFVQGFSQALELDLQRDDLTQVELTRAEALVQEKYASQEWTMRL